MGIPNYNWSSAGEFVNRTSELARLGEWWNSPSRQPLALLGRRRVGKSWLFRKFAHGKSALILVAEQLPTATQLSRFADHLEPLIGVRPQLASVGDLIRALYHAAQQERLLVVIDEFPYLLGTTAAEIGATTSEVQAALETEPDGSALKLLLCGSQVSQMEAMFSERNPLHGRLERLEVRPLGYRESHALLADLQDPIQRFERYCITGGMPLYVSRLGSGDVRDAVCTGVLDRFAPLFNEGRSLVEQELREPRVYLALLERLAQGRQQVNELAQHAGLDSSRTSKYLTTLKDLRMVTRSVPIGAAHDSRDGRWQLDDPFLRFWFRFVFPYQSDLDGGLDAGQLFDTVVAHDLADHCSPVFEQWALTWLRANLGSTAVTWGRWWGNAANTHRRDGTRTTEEIDAVGMLRNRVTAVAECKWTNRPLTPAIVHDLDRYKLPALVDSGMKISNDLRLILFCRSGYSDDLVELATDDPRIELVNVPHELSTLK